METEIGKDMEEAVMKYSDMLYKICIVILCNEQDVQDAIQETFCRYLERRPMFGENRGQPFICIMWKDIRSKRWRISWELQRAR